MRSPVSAIVWEIGRKNRWAFLVVGGSLLSGLLVHLVGPTGGDTPSVVGASAMVVSFLVIFAIFSYADGGAQIAFPERTFTLPVRTGLLVNCPILLGASAIAFLQFVWAFLFLLPLGVHYPLGWFTIYWVAALATFQAIVWCLARHTNLLVVILVLAVALFIRLAMVLTEDHDPNRAAVCLLTILPAAYLGARLGIKRQRGGHGRILGGVQGLVDRVAGVWFGRQGPFASGAKAQLWMEWRRNAVPPLIALGASLVIVCAGFVHLADHDDLGAFGSAWFYIGCSLLTLWAFIAGLLVSRDASSRSLALSSFLATRPVTSGELAFAKIKLVGRMTVCGWLLYAVGLAFWFGSSEGHPDLPFLRQDNALNPTMCFVALGLAWHLVGALPLWLTGRIASPAWAGLLLLGGYVGLANALQFLDKEVGLRVALAWLFAVAFLAKLLVAGWAFREANRRRLLSPRTSVKYLVFWVLGTICFVAIAVVLCEGTAFPRRLVVLGAALMIPLARVGLAPLALARGRHR
jgi:hypothetical protein